MPLGDQMICRIVFVLLAMAEGTAMRAQTSADIGGENVICAHQIMKPTNAQNVKIGAHIGHRWNCSEEYGPKRYFLFVRNCEQIESNGHRIILTDKFGCATSPSPSSVCFSLNYSVSAQQNANNSVLTVFGNSQLLSSPNGGFFRIECTLSLLPKAAAEGPNQKMELPNCSQNSSLSERENILGKLLTPTMDHHQKRFIDLVETTVSSEWLRVEEEQKKNGRLTLAQLFEQKENATSGVKGHQRQIEVWHDQMPISDESGEEAPEMAMNPFLERAYSVFATSSSIPTPTSATAPPVRSSTVSLLSSSSGLSVSPAVPFSVPVKHSTARNATLSPTTHFSSSSSSFAQIGLRPAAVSAANGTSFAPFIQRHRFSVNESELLPTQNPNLTESDRTKYYKEEINGIQSSVNLNSNSSFFHNLSTRKYSWTMLNTALLVWSIFSTLHWLCLLAGKLRSSVIVHRRLKISPKQKMAAAKMNAMKRKMLRTKHFGGIRQQKNLIECPPADAYAGIFCRNSPTSKRQAQQKALRTVRQRHLLHRTVIGGGIPPAVKGEVQTAAGQLQQQNQQLSLSAAVHRRQNPKNARGRRVNSNLGRICEEEEEEGKRECHRQKLVIGGGSSEEMDGSDRKSSQGGKWAEKTESWDGWMHRRGHIGQMSTKCDGRQQNWQTTIGGNGKMFKFF